MKNTKMTVNEAKEAVLRFVRVFGAGIIATALLILVGLPQGAEVVLLTAVLAAVDKYFRDKQIYTKLVNTALRK